MPEYDFVDGSGEVVALYFAMAAVPSIGDTIQRDGVSYTRIASTSARASTDRVGDRYPVHSVVLPRNIPGLPKDAKGRPIIANKRVMDRVCKEYGYVKE